MGTPTGYLIACRGSCGGDFVPLQRKSKKTGAGRFYYVHPKPKGCSHHEDFNFDIDVIEDLKALHDGLNLNEIAPPESLKLKASETATPAPESLKATPAPETLKETPQEGAGIGFFN